MACKQGLIQSVLGYSQFCGVLSLELKSLFSLGQRPVLERHTFEVKDSFSFRAQLRLSIRSQRRKIKNFVDTEDTLGDKCRVGWKFDNSIVVAEEQAIDFQGGDEIAARVDLVLDAGSYRTINQGLRKKY